MFDNIKDKIELNLQFTEAIRQENLEKLEELFSDNKEDGEKPYIDLEIDTAPAIMIAAQNKNWKILEFLYMQDAKLEVFLAPQNWYLVNECIINAPENVTKAIIDSSEINVLNLKKENPLMIAIKRGKGLIADYIIEGNKIDLSATNKDGDNAAHYAARAGNNEVFLKLIQAGVNLAKKNKDNKTPIDLIEDVTFKASLADELEKLAKKGYDVVVSEDKEVKQTKVVEEEVPVKKVSGLSSIKRK